jgi:RNA polymerase sigma-B factor
LSESIRRTLNVKDLLQIGQVAILESGTQSEGMAVTVARRAMGMAIRREVIRQRGAVEVRAGHEFTCAGEEPSSGDMWDSTIHGGEHLQPVREHFDLWRALNSLTPQEYRAVSLTFWGGMSQAEIGDDLGVSQRHVSRLLGCALKKLKEICLNRQTQAITNMWER